MYRRTRSRNPLDSTCANTLVRASVVVCLYEQILVVSFELLNIDSGLNGNRIVRPVARLTSRAVFPAESDDSEALLE